MRRRIEGALLLAVLLVGAGWALRGPLRTTRWAAVGGWELLSLPSSFPAAPPVAVPNYVAHAGGSFRGMRYTNALEALDENHARGIRWFEMDFLDDSRGEWWAVHDWKEAHDRLGLPMDAAGRGLPLQQPPGAPFHPPSLDQVLGWFTAHAEAHLVTDTKGDNAALLHRLASVSPRLRGRLHPQIYRIPEYAMARAGGFDSPIFTTYRSNYPWWVLGRFVRRAAVAAVTVSRAQAKEACAALCGQVPLLAHTLNDPAEAADLMGIGIGGVYTDDLAPAAVARPLSP